MFGIMFVIAIIEFLLMKKVSAKQSQLAGGSLPMLMPGGGGGSSAQAGRDGSIYKEAARWSL